MPTKQNSISLHSLTVLPTAKKSLSPVQAGTLPTSVPSGKPQTNASPEGIATPSGWQMILMPPYPRIYRNSSNKSPTLNTYIIMEETYLIDTHCWLNWHFNPNSLSMEQFQVMEDVENDIYFSMVSAWEINIK